MITKRQLKQFMGRGVSKQINICPIAGIVYITNQKAACSAIKLFLQRVERHDPDHTPRIVQQDDTLPRPREFGWENVCALLSGGAFVFTFVRHPITRLVSAYRDKIFADRGRNVHRIRVQRMLGVKEQPDHPPSFNQFLDALEQADPFAMDPHWRPQYINTLSPVLHYDFVGKVENFCRDFRRIKQQVGIVDIPITVRNSSKHKELPTDFEICGPQRRRIEKIYAKDFDYFDY